MNTISKLQPWPVGIVFFFLVVATVNFSLFWLAKQEPYELVTSNYYQDGLNYEQIIQAEKRLNQMQIQLNSVYKQELAGQWLEVQVQSPMKHDYSGYQIFVNLYRPSQSFLDKRLQLKQIAPDLFKSEVQNLSPGFWKLKISFMDEKGQLIYYKESPINIPS
jgi:nitrogen fixation protein FixH